jgi:hypothetical protein
MVSENEMSDTWSHIPPPLSFTYVKEMYQTYSFTYEYKSWLKSQLILVHTHLPQEEQLQCDYDASEPSGVGMSNCGYKDSSLTRVRAHSHTDKAANMAPLW